MSYVLVLVFLKFLENLPTAPDLFKCPHESQDSQILPAAHLRNHGCTLVPTLQGEESMV